MGNISISWEENTVTHKKKLFFVLPATAAYAILNLVLLLHHEAWRDESQAWLIARNLSITGVWKQLSYEGHPFLWYYLIMPFAKAGLPFSVIGFISLAVMIVAAYLLLRFSPFHPVLDLIILFSPLGTYYLPVIARSYCLCALFTVAVAVLYRSRSRRAVLYCAMIALMVQTHLIMLGFAGALSVAFLIERIADFWRDRELRGKKAIRHLAPLLLPFISFIVFLLEFMNVRSSTAYHFELKGIVDFLRSIRDTTLSLFGFMTGLDIVWVWTAIILIAFAMIYALFVLGEAGPVFITLFAFFEQIFIYAMIILYSVQRALIFVFIFVWFVYVTVEKIKEKNALRPEAEQTKPTGLLHYQLLLAMICFMLLYGLGNAVKADYQDEYSDAENAAFEIAYIVQGETVVTGEPARTSPLSAYTPDQKYWSPQIGDYVTFTPLDKEWNKPYNFLELEDAVKKAGIGDKDGFYLLIPESVGMSDYDIWKVSWEKLYETKAGTITDEKYTLYRVKY